MPQAERKNGAPYSREEIGALDVKDCERGPILNDGLVARIGETLNGAKVVRNANVVLDGWHVTVPDGLIMDFCVYPKTRGRVMSADVLAHDSVKIFYKEGEVEKTAYMKGICAISLVKSDDGTSAVEFVQKTDKYSRRIVVSDKGVNVSGNGAATKIPRRFVKDFYFFPLI